MQAILNTPIADIIKMLIALTTAFIVGTSCQKNNNDPPPTPRTAQVVPQDTCVDYVSFGTIDRRPVYPLVHFYYRLCSSGVFKDTSYNSSAYSNVPFSKFVKLSPAKYAQVRKFEQYIPAKLLNDTLTEYGAMGHDYYYIHLRLRKGTSIKEYWIDTDDSKLPEFLRPFTDTIFSYVRFLN
jgi:hypothetical protein